MLSVFIKKNCIQYNVIQKSLSALVSIVGGLSVFINIVFFVDQLQEIRKTSMARIICDNSNVGFIQPLAFQVAHQKRNPMESW